jgi:hypothetical protein
MTTEEEAYTDGAVIIGADGATYFVPNSDLDAYRVPEEAAQAFRDSLADDDEVSGFAMGSTDFGGIGSFSIMAGRTTSPDPRSLSSSDTIWTEFKRE